MSNAIVKRSNLNKLAFPQVDGIDIKRALTVKEAINKQSKSPTDYVIIEGAKTEDVYMITSLVSNGTAIGDNTLIVLLTEPAEEIDEGAVLSLRALLRTDKQCVTISRYAETETYTAIFEELNLLLDMLVNTAKETAVPEEETIKTEEPVEAPEEKPDTRTDLEVEGDLNLLGTHSFNKLQVSNQELLDLQYQLGSIREELRLAKEFIERMTNNPNISEITIGGAEAERLYDENTALKETISRLEELKPQMEEYEARIQQLMTSESMERQSVEILRTLISKVHDYGQVMRKENKVYEEKAATAISHDTEQEEKIITLQAKERDLRAQIDTLSETIAQLRDENAELNIDLNNAVATGKSFKDKIDDLDGMVSRLNDEKKNLMADLNKAEAEVARLSTYDIEILKQRATDGGNVQELLEKSLRETKELLRQTDEKNKSLAKELANSSKRVEKLQAENRVLQGMLDGENYGSRGITWLRPVQARLITFIGHGGQGCSSVAAGLAQRLYEGGKSVVLVDCDFRAPKQHALFNVNPVIEFTSYSKLTAEMKTSLGKILCVGAPIYSHLDQELVIHIAENRNARLDILSGLIACRSSSEVSSIDFNALCVELATKYDYIIVDLGRSEGNGGIARQQQAFMGYANRKFIVTSNNMECVKSIASRLVQARIDIDSTELIFNMVQDKPDKGLENIIRRVKKVYTIEMDKSLIGKTVPLRSNHSVIKQIAYSELGDSRK